MTSPEYARTLAENVARSDVSRQIQQQATGTHGSGCDAARTMHPHQKIFHAHCTNMARLIATYSHAWTDLVPKGTLAFHSTGSGKSAIAVSILDAFYPLLRGSRGRGGKSKPATGGDDAWRIYMVTTSENVKGNMNVGTFAKEAEANSFPHFASRASGPAFASWFTAKVRKEAGFTREDTFISYEQAVSRLTGKIGRKSAHINPKRSIFILDEAQNVTMGNIRAARKFYDLLDKLDASLIFMLTATPGVSPRGLVQLMNLTEFDHGAHLDYDELVDGDSRLLPGALERLTTFARGKVSYIDMRGVQTMFPRLEVAEESVDATPLQLARFHTSPAFTHTFAKTLSPSVFREKMADPTGAGGKDLDRLQGILSAPRSGFVGRTCAYTSNDRSLGENLAKAAKGRASTEGAGASSRKKPPRPFVDLDVMGELMPKGERMVRRVAAEMGEKHFVYAREKRHAEALKCLLTGTVDRDDGTVWLDLDDHYKYGEMDLGYYTRILERNNAQRFAVALYTTDKGWARASPSMTHRQYKLKLYNHADNLGGRVFHVMFGTDQDYEGVDVRGARVLHQMEAMLSVPVRTQLDGRLVRTKSLCMYPHDREGQTVRKYVYMTHMESEEASRELVHIAEKLRLVQHERMVLSGEVSVTGDTRGDLQSLTSQMRHMLQDGFAMGSKEASLFVSLHDRQRDLVAAMHTQMSAMDPDRVQRLLADLEAQERSLEAQRDAVEADTLPSVEGLIASVAAERYVILGAFYGALRRAAFDCASLHPINSNADGTSVSVGEACAIVPLHDPTANLEAVLLAAGQAQ